MSQDKIISYDTPLFWITLHSTFLFALSSFEILISFQYQTFPFCSVSRLFHVFYSLLYLCFFYLCLLSYPRVLYLLNQSLILHFLHRHTSSIDIALQNLLFNIPLISEQHTVYWQSFSLAILSRILLRSVELSQSLFLNSTKFLSPYSNIHWVSHERDV